MAGNHNSGRKRKPTAELKLYGAFSQARHGRRADDLFPAGKPEKLIGMTAGGRKAFDLVVQHFPAGVLSPLDAPMLAGMAEWFALYWSIHRAMAKAGTVEPAMITAAQTAWRCFRDAAVQFGMSPSARAKFEAAGTQAATVDDLERFMKQ